MHCVHGPQARGGSDAMWTPEPVCSLRLRMQRTTGQVPIRPDQDHGDYAS